jgi:DNA polymerase (family 10)
MDNQRIANVFQEIGDILEIQDANRFRILAYQKAAQTIANLGEELSDIYMRDPKELEKVPGIGKDLAAKIVELIEKGKCTYHEELIKKFDRGILDMLRVRGVGPKKVKLFYSELRINSISALRDAAEKGLLRDLPRMGEKSEKEILEAIDEFEKHSERMAYSDALHEALALIAYMKKCRDVKRIEYAGSLRRKRDTIGDLDILVVSVRPEKVMNHFVKYENVSKVIARGDTKTSLLLDMGAQVDLRVIKEKSFGAAWHYFTGSKEHNVAIRDMAKKKGLKVNEYGVFRVARGGGRGREKYLAGKTEEEVYKSVGLPYIEPELRENRGELEAAKKRKLPDLIELKDLRGDLHTHSSWSDGSEEIEDVARAYIKAGFEYIALTDHSPAVRVAHGLTPERFAMQWDEIDELNAEFARKGIKFRILKGTECDIMPDGTMDLPDRVLKKMDIVVAAVHSKFNLSEREQTARVIKAFKNPYVKIWGHPSSRLINQREPYAVDMGKAISAAVKNHVALEINSQPDRLDLFDYYCRLAKEKGAKFTVDSDSHHHSQIAFLEYGVGVARRGWLEADDVLNTRSLAKVLDYWKK